MNAPVNLPGEKEKTMTTTTDTQQPATPGQVAPVVQPPNATRRFVFFGGPNNGAEFFFTPKDHQCDLMIGKDRYVLREHDSVLLFSPRTTKFLVCVDDEFGQRQRIKVCESMSEAQQERDGVIRRAYVLEQQYAG